MYILGRRVNFVPHKGSIDGTEPNQTAIWLAQAPVKEVIAQKTQAMCNTSTSSPLVYEKLFTKAMKELADTMDDKLTKLTNNINLNPDMRIEPSTDTLKMYAMNIHNIMSVMTMEFQQLNHRIHNIMQTLAATSLDPLPSTHTHTHQHCKTTTYSKHIHGQCTCRGQQCVPTSAPGIP